MKTFITLVAMFFIVSGCSQEDTLGPAYNFKLFKNTPNWDLAKAVENEDEPKMNAILSKGDVTIDLQEPVYGKTLLLLAIGNGKVLSTKILLDHNANLTVEDHYSTNAINEATYLVELKKNPSQILELVLAHGGDPNSVLILKRGADTVNHGVPLLGAVRNLACTKLLLSHGANLYYKDNHGYPVWTHFLSLDGPNQESILVAKYIIVDKKMPIPDPILYTLPDNQPKGILEMLNKFDVHNDSQKAQAKNDILAYLKKIDFPNTGVFKGEQK